MPKLIIYKVTGKQGFPIDMLRYDMAWPYRGEDAGEIHASLSRRELDRKEPYVIELASFSPPTVMRWRSFGWGVVA